MAEDTKPVANKSMSWNDMETKLEDIFGKKAPQLPANVKEFIVKYGPYIAIVFLVLSLPVILTALGLTAVLSPFAMMDGYRSYGGFSLSMIFVLISIVLEILALPGLFKRSLAGWRFMFYNSLVSAVSALLSLNLVGMVIGLAISFYFLFQIKPLYK